MHFKSATDVLAYVIPFAMRAELAQDDYDLQCQVWKSETVKQLERLRAGLLLLPPPLRGVESLDLLNVEQAWLRVCSVPLEVFPGWCHELIRNVRHATIRGEQHEVQF
jgi:hypothetical protein